MYLSVSSYSHTEFHREPQSFTEKKKEFSNPYVIDNEILLKGLHERFEDQFLFLKWKIQFKLNGYLNL